MEKEVKSAQRQRHDHLELDELDEEADEVEHVEEVDRDPRLLEASRLILLIGSFGMLMFVWLAFSGIAILTWPTLGSSEPITITSLDASSSTSSVCLRPRRDDVMFWLMLSGVSSSSCSTGLRLSSSPSCEKSCDVARVRRSVVSAAGLGLAASGGMVQVNWEVERVGMAGLGLCGLRALRRIAWWRARL